MSGDSRHNARPAVPSSAVRYTAFNPAPGLLRFLNWLVRPTLPAVLGMVSTLVALLAIAFTLSDAALYRLVSAYPLSKKQEATAPYLFRRLQRFLHDEGRHLRTDLAVIGGSTSLESLWSEQALAAGIERLNGGRIGILDLTSGGQRLHESWALAESAACNGADVVLLGANVNRFIDRGAADRRDPFFLTGGLGADVEAYIGSGAVDPQHATLTHRVFDRPAFVAQTIKLSFGAMLESPPGFAGHKLPQQGPAPEDLRHLYLQRPRNEERKAKRLATVERMFAEAQGRGFKYPVFERIRGSVERCGARLIAFIPPVNPRMLDLSLNPVYAGAYVAHEKYLRTYLGDDSLVILNRWVEYSPDDFFDWGHLSNEAAIRASTAALAHALAPLLKEAGP